MDPLQNPWVIRGEKEIYDNPWIRVTEYDVLNPKGKPGIYGKVHFKNIAIGILALDEAGMIQLVGQYRFPLGAYSWEIPEGGGLWAHDPLESARRELKEETGLVAAHWEVLLRMHLSNSVSDEYAIVYLATGLVQETPEPEDTEALSHRKVTLEEAYQMVRDHQITDSMSVAAILQLRMAILEKRITFP
jgi:8-oxo-dGTP pyrophosphatase MutT (NUDIX family)